MDSLHGDFWWEGVGWSGTAWKRWLVCDLGCLELTDSRGQFGRLYRQVYRKESKLASMQVSKLVCK